MENRDYISHYQLDAELFSYFENNKFDEDYNNRLHSFINKFIKATNNKILDVGSGGGWSAKKLKKSGDLFLIDLSFKNLSIIKNSYDSYCIQSDAIKLPFRDNTFDYVIISEVLEHINKPEYAIKEALRVTKKEGIVIITTPFKEKIKYYLCIHCNKMTPANAHLHSFSIEKFKEMCKDFSYSEIKFYKFGSKLLTVTRVSYFIRFLPFWVWRMKDVFLNLLFNKPNTLVVILKK